MSRRGRGGQGKVVVVVVVVVDVCSVRRQVRVGWVIMGVFGLEVANEVIEIGSLAEGRAGVWKLLAHGGNQVYL